MTSATRLATTRRSGSIAGAAGLLGAVALVSIATAPVRIAGPFNLWPPPPTFVLAGATLLAAGGGLLLRRCGVGHRSGAVLAGAGLLLAAVTALHVAKAPSSTPGECDGRYVAPPAWTFAAGGALATACLASAPFLARRRPAVS